MWWHKNIQNKIVGLGRRPLVSTWNMYRALDSPESVETTITNKYRRTCWTKNCQEELVRIGGWPPISTWINPPPLGSNGLHCIKCPHQVRKFLLNLALGEPLALVQELSCLDNLINLDPLLVSAFDLCVHYLISGCLFHAVWVEICFFQLLFDL